MRLAVGALTCKALGESEAREGAFVDADLRDSRICAGLPEGHLQAGSPRPRAATEALQTVGWLPRPRPSRQLGCLTPLGLVEGATITEFAASVGEAAQRQASDFQRFCSGFLPASMASGLGVASGITQKPDLTPDE